MITLKEWMEVVDYRITEGGDYNLFSPNAYALTSWNGDQNGYSLEIIFDQRTQEVFCVEAHDYKHQRAYRLFNPDYADVDTNDEAWDDVKWTTLEADDDWIQKALAITAGEDYDTRVSVPLDLDDDLVFSMMKMAHERDITFNELVEDVLQQALEDHSLAEELKMPTSWTVTLDEDPETGDLILPLPEDLLKMQGWKEGDTLDWNNNNDGTWSISKK
jgi:hypothetical protein